MRRLQNSRTFQIPRIFAVPTQSLSPLGAAVVEVCFVLCCPLLGLAQVAAPDSAHPAPVPVPEPSRLHQAYPLLGLVLVLFAVVVFTAGRRKYDENTMLEQGPKGIGGWLVLPAFGLVLSPIVAAASIYADYQFLPKVPATYVSAMNASIGRNVILAILSLYAAGRFFQKRQDAPFAVTLLLSVNLLLSVLLAGNYGEMFAKNAVFSVIQAAIWIPYFVVSRRVKATFQTGKLRTAGALCVGRWRIRWQILWVCTSVLAACFATAFCVLDRQISTASAIWGFCLSAFIVWGAAVTAAFVVPPLPSISEVLKSTQGAHVQDEDTKR